MDEKPDTTPEMESEISDDALDNVEGGAVIFGNGGNGGVGGTLGVGGNGG